MTRSSRKDVNILIEDGYPSRTIALGRSYAGQTANRRKSRSIVPPGCGSQ